MSVSFRSWTRAELEAEARRRGVEEPWLLSRAQLVARLGGEEERLRDVAARAAGRLMRGAVGRVVDQLPELLGPPPLPRDAGRASPPLARTAARRWLEPLAARARAAIFGPDAPPPRPSPFPPPPDPAPGDVRVAPPPRGRPAPAPPPASPFPPPSSPPEPEPPAEPGPPSRPEAPTADAPARSAPDEAPDGAPAPEPTTMPTPEPGSPPIESVTLARLLARQGREERALGMLASLLDKHPEDEALRREALAIEAGLGGPLRAVRTRRRVDIAWRLPLDGAPHARRLAGGEDASLVLRTVVIARDPRAIVRSRTIDEPVSKRRGDARVNGVPPDARATVSLGWRGPERFVSIGHVEVPAPAD